LLQLPTYYTRALDPYRSPPFGAENLRPQHIHRPARIPLDDRAEPSKGFDE